MEIHRYCCCVLLSYRTLPLLLARKVTPASPGIVSSTAMASTTAYQPRSNSLSDFSSKDSDPYASQKYQRNNADDIQRAEHHESVPQPSDALPQAEIEQTTTAMHPEKTSSHLQKTRTMLGLHPTAPVVHEHDVAEHSSWWWARVRMSMKEPFAEVRHPPSRLARTYT